MKFNEKLASRLQASIDMHLAESTGSEGDIATAVSVITVGGVALAKRLGVSKERYLIMIGAVWDLPEGTEGSQSGRLQ